MNKGMRKEFFGSIQDEKEAVKAFLSSNAENALKTYVLQASAI